MICLGSAEDAGNCLAALAGPNSVSEKITERAREKVMKAQREAPTTRLAPARPSTSKALAERDRRPQRDLVNSRKLTNNFIVKPLAQVRKVVDPRVGDIQEGLTKASREGREDRSSPVRGRTHPRRPGRSPPASKFLKGLGKVGKGLGIAGTALSLYDNVKNDGLAKGLTKTAGGVAGAWGAGAAVTAGCGAIGVATAGVGGLVCAGLAFGAAYHRRQVRLADRRLGLRSRRGRRELRQRERVQAGRPRDRRRRGGQGQGRRQRAVDGGKKVIGALNPFG